LSGGLGELNKLIPIPHSWEVKFKAMEDAYAEQVMIIGNMKNFADYIISLIMIAILPAFLKSFYLEVLYKNYLSTGFRIHTLLLLLPAFCLVLFTVVIMAFYQEWVWHFTWIFILLWQEYLAEYYNAFY